ncbi:hypothetical protein TeGR_g11029 [Tetraparma gracilis]|uniref:Uncharacterized protein n=1 Tax=Tetraparma gracilis TaxID=2962635 RepID=A0ABQ6M372_9STRA|nr:hypothetical protein TeGR_g11029 [Tetraparma gracilis]
MMSSSTSSHLAAGSGASATRAQQATPPPPSGDTKPAASAVGEKKATYKDKVSAHPPPKQQDKTLAPAPPKQQDKTLASPRAKPTLPLPPVSTKLAHPPPVPRAPVPSSAANANAIPAMVKELLKQSSLKSSWRSPYSAACEGLLKTLCRYLTRPHWLEHCERTPGPANYNKAPENPAFQYKNVSTNLACAEDLATFNEALIQIAHLERGISAAQIQDSALPDNTNVLAVELSDYIENIGDPTGMSSSGFMEDSVLKESDVALLHELIRNTLEAIEREKLHPPSPPASPLSLPAAVPPPPSPDGTTLLATTLATALNQRQHAVIDAAPVLYKALHSTIGGGRDNHARPTSIIDAALKFQSLFKFVHQFQIAKHANGELKVPMHTMISEISNAIYDPLRTLLAAKGASFQRTALLLVAFPRTRGQDECLNTLQEGNPALLFQQFQNALEELSRTDPECVQLYSDARAALHPAKRFDSCATAWNTASPLIMTLYSEQYRESPNGLIEIGCILAREWVPEQHECATLHTFMRAADGEDIQRVIQGSIIYDRPDTPLGLYDNYSHLQNANEKLNAEIPWGPTEHMAPERATPGKLAISISRLDHFAAGVEIPPHRFAALDDYDLFQRSGSASAPPTTPEEPRKKERKKKEPSTDTPDSAKIKVRAERGSTRESITDEIYNSFETAFKIHGENVDHGSVEATAETDDTIATTLKFMASSNTARDCWEECIENPNYDPDRPLFPSPTFWSDPPSRDTIKRQEIPKFYATEEEYLATKPRGKNVSQNAKYRCALCGHGHRTKICFKLPSLAWAPLVNHPVIYKYK